MTLGAARREAPHVLAGRSRGVDFEPHVRPDRAADPPARGNHLDELAEDAAGLGTGLALGRPGIAHLDA